MNSKLSGYVHEVDKLKNRISLTTYEPVDWPVKMPSKDYIIGNGQMIDDEEELGGSSRGSVTNARSLEKTLSLQLDDDDLDDEWNEDEDEEQGEELSMEEINRLTGGKRKSQLLLNDDNDSSTSSASSSSSATDTDPTASTSQLKPRNDIENKAKVSTSSSTSSSAMDYDPSATEEISTEELFAELRTSKSQPYLTYKEIKKWDYLKDFIVNGDISETEIKQLIQNSSGTGEGKLNVDQFEVFLDNLVEFLGLQDIDDVYEDDEEEEEEEEEEEQDGTPPSISNNIPSSKENSRTSSTTAKETRDTIILDDMEEDDEEETVSVSVTHTSTSTTNNNVNDDKDDDLETISMSSDGISMVVPEKSKSVKAGVGVGFGNAKNIDMNKESEDTSSSLSLEEHFSKKSGTNDLLQYVYQGIMNY